MAEPFVALLEWYRHNRRALPWREAPDPYAILVSEVMLQQTRVETVIPYYHEFLRRFPSPQALASAQLDSVYEAWAGLGYYRRARNLQSAAQCVVERGGFPTLESELRQLPGVGDYTAAAMASIAFGQPALALDGNALRVLTRLYGVQTPSDSGATKRELRRLTIDQIPRDQAGDFTQSIMELGARLCLPRKPICGKCPLQTHCRAYAGQLTEEIPTAKKRRSRESVTLVALRIRNARDQVLLENRQDSPFLAHQWMPPWFFEARSQQSILDYQARFLGTPPRYVGTVAHQVTYRDLTVQIWEWQTSIEAKDENQQFRAWDPATTRLPRLASKILSTQ